MKKIDPLQMKKLEFKISDYDQSYAISTQGHDFRIALDISLTPKQVQHIETVYGLGQCLRLRSIQAS